MDFKVEEEIHSFIQKYLLRLYFRIFFSFFLEVFLLTGTTSSVKEKKKFFDSFKLSNIFSKIVGYILYFLYIFYKIKLVKTQDVSTAGIILVMVDVKFIGKDQLKICSVNSILT